METTIEFRQAVHKVMIDMALNCTFPMDMNELCIATVFEKANEILKGDKNYQRYLLLEKLGRFICIEDDSDDILNTWNSLTSDNDKDMADDYFTMWEPLENSLTIKQIAEQL